MAGDNQRTAYPFAERARALVNGFRNAEPLLEVARKGISGRYELTEKQRLKYSRRIAKAYPHLYPANRAEIDYVIENFSTFPTQVQKEALHHLSANIGRLDEIVVDAYCEMPSGGSGIYHSWVRTRDRVRKLVAENAHMLV
ncbi:MAG: hypothetical protein AB1295_04195 [Candidatus Micrarchaeota archaeon]